MAEQTLAKENSVTIIGRLVDVDFKEVEKNGSKYAIATATVVSSLKGKDNTFKIDFIASELTQEGKPNGLYQNYVRIPELKGKKVEVKGSLRENRRWNKSREQMSSFTTISGRFLTAAMETSIDCATFFMSGFIVKALEEKKNKAGEVYRYDFSLGQANYKGDNLSVFGFNVYPSDVEIRNGVSGWNVGQTVKIQGELMCVETITTVEDKAGGFGAPITRTYTNTNRGYYITGGSNPLSLEDGAYPTEIVQSLISAYKAKDVEIMNASKNSETVERPVQTASAPVTSRQASLI